MLGTWIDGLTDEQRDRIVTGRRWEPGYFHKGGEPACVVGHAYEITETSGITVARAAVGSQRELDLLYDRFDVLTRRFGLERVVRACKKRAAKGNRIDLTPSPTEAKVGA